MNEYKSYFKDHCVNFVNKKRSLGYDYKSQSKKLKKFDDYLFENNINEITKDVVTSYLDNLKMNRASVSSHATAIRQFSMYLSYNGIKVYLLPKRLYTRGNSKPEPHIYSDEEVIKIFKAINSYFSDNIYKKEIVLMIFKLLYCTGLRVSECCNIKIGNIDVEKHTIAILNTKNGTDRSIVISDELINELKMLNDTYNLDYQKDDYFFRRPNNKKYGRNDIYHIFRKVLFCVKIPHTQTGPTVHHFRHTYCVNVLKKMIDQKVDLLSYIPVLCAYTGHTNYDAFSYYLKLTSLMSDDIRSITEKYTTGIIRGEDDE